MTGHLPNHRHSRTPKNSFEKILEKTEDLNEIQRQILLNRILELQANAETRNRLSVCLTLSTLDDEQLAHLIEAIANIIRRRQSS